jgi:CelD/BcsL family acetyltransferase involved in cellulose biosynthesis
MKFTTLAGKELDSGLCETWEALRGANEALENPFFHSLFTQCVAEVRPNVEVTVIENEGKIVGFFPFERVSKSYGAPVADPLSDYHGVIAAGDLAFDPYDLLRASGLATWRFSHLPASQKAFRSGMRTLVASPQMDLADGYSAYVARKKASGSALIERSAYLERRLNREVGTMRYVACEANPAILEQVLTWKSAQYERTGKRDIFRAAWTSALLRAIHHTESKGFAGVLSALYAGDHLIAGHFGMRSASAWHYWFPSHDPAYAKYSPGLILILKMAESAPGLGLNAIDLGAGLSTHKERLSDKATMVAAGSAELPTWAAACRSVGRNAAVLVRNSPLHSPARAIARGWRSLVGE